jgi:phospholipid/cholesterol/gamma-HCH transport system substrate-binding protein
MLPFRLRQADRIVAAFLLAVTAVVAVALFLVVESQGLFKARREYRTVFKDGGGLRPETPVRIAGIEVGSIRRVTLTPQDEVEVVFDVLDEYADRLRADPLDGTCAKAGFSSMMDSDEKRHAAGELKKRCGSRVAASVPAGLGSFLPTSSGLTVIVGNRTNPVIPPGSFVPAEEPEGIGEFVARLQKEGLVQTAKDIVNQVDAVLRMVNDADGPVQKTLSHVEQVTARAAEGRGLVGEMTRDNSETQKRVTASLEKLSKALEDLQASSASIQTVTSGIAARNGDIQGVVDKLDTFATSANATGKDLATFAKGAKDVPADVKEAVANLNRRIDDLGIIIAGLKKSFPFNMVVDEPEPKKK